MLSPESAATVRATLPAIGGAIDDISARFYEGMFADHPDLLRTLFNRGNQASGRQRAALAASIVAFAAGLVERSGPPLDAMLARISHKHASLGVTAEQYDVVHKYLFAAIDEVLGGAVTPEVGQAWDEVYWLMADALIRSEARLRGASPGGGAWRRATVTERRDETPDVVSFTLRPEVPAAFAPGQYVSVAVTLPDGARQIRQYSLSGAPSRDRWRVSVKRARGGGPDGEVSAWLHANARPGDTLTVSAPFGDVTLPEGEAPLLLASAGIGVTPVVSMAAHLAATGSRRRVVVVHGDRSPADHAHREELESLVAALPGATLHLFYREAPGAQAGHRVGRVDLGAVDLPGSLVAYLCGPLPFMRDVRAHLLARGIPAGAVHYEVFGPDHWLGRS
ncbi:FAD-binding oxidoreductase [Microbispora corallina]|uniref:nitric oxide dioxygenase n=1 Tax=Microbispora corallina TaxID=83302 RepID=A0ABQ4FYH3_9ACTN|nr:globin domain-containing protein [Microbispora corallina]GIH39856.1 hemin transporter [Microbispora corallina]